MTTVFDVRSVLGEAGAGVLWSAPPGDLNANVVSLPAQQQIDEHRQDEVDVLVVVLAGDGEIDIDDETHDVSDLQVVLIPAGTRRAIRAHANGLAYVTVHRARGPLKIGRLG